ncbi:MAG: lamin tail domain-containing protein, partial [Verrucomicrobia bacterium]|nr:lamin tail domain-containing protein [Verrucomicrobiota bacterium]
MLLGAGGLSSQAQVAITEFMAHNTRTLTDEDGDNSDWIEIENQGTASVDLHNWALTDNPSNLRQWKFPSTNLASGELLLVFASGKNRRLPGQPLHTNFKLGNDGDYLALVQADGVTRASEFAPKYPPQLPDISYGFGMDVSQVVLASNGAPSRWLIPTVGNGGDQLGDSWKGGVAAFDDSAWGVSHGAIGFSRTPTNLVAATSLVVRLNFNAPPLGSVVADSKPAGSARNATNNGATWSSFAADAANPPRVREGVMGFDASARSQIVLSPQADLNGAKGTVAFWVKTEGNTGPGSQGAILFDRRSTRGDVLALGDDGRLFVQAQSAAGVVRNSFFSNQPLADGLWHHVAYVYDQSAGGATQLFLDGLLDRSQANSGAWSWDAARPLSIGRSEDPSWRAFEGVLDDFRFYKRALASDEIAALHTGDGGFALPPGATDVGSAVQGQSRSAYLRLPFVVADPAAFALVTLTLNYNDGYVAYLNGQEVALDNAPASLLWDSAAVDVHSGAVTETATFGGVAQSLRVGTNILAIQGLNINADSPDFFVSAT